MIPQGRLLIDMNRDGSVHITSNRTSDIGKLMIGREPAGVLEVLPLVFSLCRYAHVAVARQAMALRTPKDARRDAAMVLAENAREHLLRILLGWRAPELSGSLAAVDVMPLTARMDAVAGQHAGETSEAGHLEQVLKQHVLGVSTERFLRLVTLGEFHDWLGGLTTQSAGYLQVILNRFWAGIGAVNTQFLPDIPDGTLAACLAEPNFAMRPQWQGVPQETGPLARQAGHPLVQTILAQYGGGLLARLVARLVDLAKIPGQMRSVDILPPSEGGIGRAETARGRLVHGVHLVGGRVAQYSVLAPTEWNFHPKGVAVQALQAMPPSPDRPERMRAMIEAIDPCVDFEVRAA